MDYKYYTSNNYGKDDYGLKYIDEQGYGLICKEHRMEFPPQYQDVQPGMEYLMKPRPIFKCCCSRSFLDTTSTSMLGGRKNIHIRFRCTYGKSRSAI